MQFCPKCSTPVTADMHYCPQCGTVLNAPSASLSLGSQLTAYVVSIFLPPFGLVYVPRYWRMEGTAPRRIAWTIIILTILSTAVTIWSFFAFLQVAQQYLGNLSPVGF